MSDKARGFHSLFFAAILLMLLFGILSASPTVAGSETQGSVPEGYDQRQASNRMVYLWRSQETDASVAAAAIKMGDGLFDGVANFLGKERTPQEDLIVVLDGPMFTAKGRNIPRIDDDGRIYLYTMQAPMNEYMSVFAHELVHAFRFRDHFEGEQSAKLGTGFFEEGFAEAVALQVEGHANRYPYWGVSPTAINAYLIQSERVIPLDKLINQHAELTFKCEAQTYPIRGSFLSYLDGLLGREAFLAMADERAVRDTVFYEKHTGKVFGALQRAWQDHVMDQARELADAAEQAQQWVAMNEKIGISLCAKGVDY